MASLIETAISEPFLRNTNDTYWLDKCIVTAMFHGHVGECDLMRVYRRIIHDNNHPLHQRIVKQIYDYDFLTLFEPIEQTLIKSAAKNKFIITPELVAKTL